MVVFRDRSDAGRRLAVQLRGLQNEGDVLVLGLPRGGVPVAFEVARELGVALDVEVVRKLGAPQEPELAIGAIASGGTKILNSAVIRDLGITPAEIESIAAEEKRELERRELAYRGDRPAADVADKTVIVIDDGLATGFTMRAAVASVRARKAARIVVAVPVASLQACKLLRSATDEVLCLSTPADFYAVGQWYEEFSQTTDAEVRDLISRASAFSR